ncbi:MAG: polymer-forming cytoskeletal protein [Planctomycetota bacterium]|jgi:hypothetical protein
MRTDRNKVPSKRRGSALPLVLSVLVILLAMGTGMLGLGLHSRIFSTRTTSEIAARCAADAGLTKALFEMNQKLRVKPWSESELPEATDAILTNCDATFSYAITGDISSGFAVESVGKCGQVEERVNATLRLQGPFECAVFGDDSVELKNGATVDGYNFADGENLKAGTNSIESGAVDLKNSSTVNGDVVVGVDGNPDTVINATWATITGETYAMADEQPLPPITVPVWLDGLANGKVITIDGPVILYITGDVILNNSAELQITNNDGVSLTMYLAGGVEVKNSGTVNNLTEDPRKLRIYGLDGCQSIILKNASDFYGAIYAPNADVEMMNSADAFGAVVAKSFDQKNSADFNYDASLRDASVDDEAVRFVVKQWRE